MSAPLSAILNPPGANPSPPSTLKKSLKRLTRNQQVRIRVLRDIGWAYKDIALKYDVTIRAVQYACMNPQTPKKRSGRPSRLSEEQVECLIDFVTYSKLNRRLPYYRNPDTLRFDCGVDLIQYALKRKGFKRCLARNKPPISKKNQQDRLTWALEHVNWTQEQ